MAHVPDPLPEYPAPDPETGRGASKARWTLCGLLVLVAFPALLFLRIAGYGGLDQTALFYVGLPVVIALSVVLLARPKSAVGVAVAVTTVLLLLSGPLLGEGLVCLVISAPLIYGVVALVTWMCVSRSGRDPYGPHSFIAVPVLFVLTLEGVGGLSLLPRENVGAGEVLVEAAPERVAAALAAPPEYERPEAAFLRVVPFPEPVEAVGEGLAVGDTRLVHFTPRRSLAIGAEPTPRSLELEIVESEVATDGGRVVFDVVDDTVLARWMDLRRATATWTREGDRTRLAWEFDYVRTYDPSWYFGPVQGYTTDLAAAYLAETFAAGAERSTGAEGVGRP
ncbi:hypothetical protein ACFWZ7_20300 [Nocardiopsis alba]|uniref:hypothetical protein n=1 Tax=Nocardiopsis alba TaxID=53437 RepID=UPI00366B6BCA